MTILYTKYERNCLKERKKRCRLETIIILCQQISLQHFNKPQLKGSQPEWCISSMINSRDTPFWSGTLEMWKCFCVCFLLFVFFLTKSEKKIHNNSCIRVSWELCKKIVPKVLHHANLATHSQWQSHWKQRSMFVQICREDWKQLYQCLYKSEEKIESNYQFKMFISEDLKKRQTIKSTRKSWSHGSQSEQINRERERERGGGGGWVGEWWWGDVVHACFGVCMSESMYHLIQPSYHYSVWKPHHNQIHPSWQPLFTTSHISIADIVSVSAFHNDNVQRWSHQHQSRLHRHTLTADDAVKKNFKNKQQRNKLTSHVQENKLLHISNTSTT